MYMCVQLSSIKYESLLGCKGVYEKQFFPYTAKVCVCAAVPALVKCDEVSAHT